MQPSEDIDRRGGGEEAFDRGAGLAGVRREGPEGLVAVVEKVVDFEEGVEAAPFHGDPGIEHPVGRQGRLAIRFVAAQELATDIAGVKGEREPGPGAVGEARVDPMPRHEGE